MKTVFTSHPLDWIVCTSCDWLMFQVTALSTSRNSWTWWRRRWRRPTARRNSGRHSGSSIKMETGKQARHYINNIIDPFFCWHIIFFVYTQYIKSQTSFSMTVSNVHATFPNLNSLGCRRAWFIYLFIYLFNSLTFTIFTIYHVQLISVNNWIRLIRCRSPSSSSPSCSGTHYYY